MSDPDKQDFSYIRQDPVLLGRDFDTDGVSVTRSVMAETRTTRRARVLPTSAGDEVELSIDRSEIHGAWIRLSPDQARHIGQLLLDWANRIRESSEAGGAPSAAASLSAGDPPADE